MYDWIRPWRPHAGATTDARVRQITEDTNQITQEIDRLIDRVEWLDNATMSKADRALLVAGISSELKAIREHIRSHSIAVQHLLEDATEHLNTGVAK